MRRDLTQLFAVYAGLLVLFAATTGAAFVNLGALNVVVNLGIATVKAALVYWFFMELRTADGLVRIAALSVLFWLLILLGADVVIWFTRVR